MRVNKFLGKRRWRTTFYFLFFADNRSGSSSRHDSVHLSSGFWICNWALQNAQQRWEYKEKKFDLRRLFFFFEKKNNKNKIVGPLKSNFAKCLQQLALSWCAYVVDHRSPGNGTPPTWAKKVRVVYYWCVKQTCSDMTYFSPLATTLLQGTEYLKYLSQRKILYSMDASDRRSLRRHIDDCFRHLWGSNSASSGVWGWWEKKKRESDSRWNWIWLTSSLFLFGLWLQFKRHPFHCGR